MTPLAHTGHWLIQVLYVVPVVVIVVWISIKSVIDRRREDAPPPEPGGPAPGPPA